jgi:hypothetical protein
VGAGVGEFEYVQAQVTFVAAPIVTDDGDAVNVASTGATGCGVTVRLSCRVALPAELLHVTVNVVVALSVTLAVPPLLIVPTPLSIEHAGVGVGLLE